MNKLDEIKLRYNNMIYKAYKENYQFVLKHLDNEKYYKIYKFMNAHLYKNHNWLFTKLSIELDLKIGLILDVNDFKGCE